MNVWIGRSEGGSDKDGAGMRRQTRRARAARRIILRALADPDFPLTFFARNVVAVKREAAWVHLPVRVQRDHLLRMLRERSCVFLEVKIRLEIQEDRRKPRSVRTDEDSASLAFIQSYCNDCGVCCEIASGYPDFPPCADIPARWKNIFGGGLGKGHRFCPFLLEPEGSGRSLCGIHPWRPNPCRIFEEDECRYLRHDPGFVLPADKSDPAGVRRWLFRLMNGR